MRLYGRFAPRSQAFENRSPDMHMVILSHFPGSAAAVAVFFLLAPSTASAPAHISYRRGEWQHHPAAINSKWSGATCVIRWR
jgi:hypothetical protein